MTREIILRVVSKLLLPYILLFALYVQFHGDYGPGGGFQAGVIVAAGFVLYSLVFGLPAAHKVVPEWLLDTLLAIGVLIYGAVGVLTIFEGGNFLDYGALGDSPVHGQHQGILLVELGVGISVAAAMISIFLAFAGRERSE